MTQQNIFGFKRIGETPGDELLKESYEIVNKAIIDHNPYAICLMLSGGDDSITALEVALLLGVKIDFIIHGVTGTGLPAVRKYVNEVARIKNIKLIEANAGHAFENYVRRKGFFGVGKDAHRYSYHVLKSGPFEKIISKHITQGQKGRKILLLNGVRVEESENRADNFGDNPYTFRKNLIWVNIIHWFTKTNCLDLLAQNKVERNPVSIILGRSGECNCGTTQSAADRQAASDFDPAWGKWMDALRKEITAKFGWDIWQNPKKDQLAEVKRISQELSDFMPMCVGCKHNDQALKLF